MIHEKNYLIFLILLVSISIIILFFPNKNISERLTNSNNQDIIIKSILVIKESKFSITQLNSPNLENTNKDIIASGIMALICPDEKNNKNCYTTYDTGSPYFVTKTQTSCKQGITYNINYITGMEQLQAINYNLVYTSINNKQNKLNLNIGNVCSTKGSSGGNIGNLMGVGPSKIEKYAPLPIINQVNKRFIFWFVNPDIQQNKLKLGLTNAIVGFISQLPTPNKFFKRESSNINTITMNMLTGFYGWAINSSIKIGDKQINNADIVFDTGNSVGVTLSQVGLKYKRYISNTFSISINNYKINVKNQNFGVIENSSSNKTPNISLGLPLLIRMMYGMAYDKKAGKLYMWARKDAIQNNYDSTNRTTTTTKMPVTTTTTKKPVINNKNKK